MEPTTTDYGAMLAPVLSVLASALVAWLVGKMKKPAPGPVAPDVPQPVPAPLPYPQPAPAPPPLLPGRPVLSGLAALLLQVAAEVFRKQLVGEALSPDEQRAFAQLQGHAGLMLRESMPPPK